MNNLPFTKSNIVWFSIGIGMLILGYILMMIGPHDSFFSLTLSPIILTLAYVVILPYSILKKSRN
ncbi:MAG: hypothetical protein CR982_00115 [Candidatus Cloacimonadota bacterium]|nr:MAG: hypothetical protein CR982_00115 [Candidatus Cloacimonadota bacterium]PIE79110.1 MAG: hypothetical protein CSA15_04360 [Candidatus Delongbacteria bacterium]